MTLFIHGGCGVHSRSVTPGGMCAAVISGQCLGSMRYAGTLDGYSRRWPCLQSVLLSPGRRQLLLKHSGRGGHKGTVGGQGFLGLHFDNVPVDTFQGGFSLQESSGGSVPVTGYLEGQGTRTKLLCFRMQVRMGVWYWGLGERACHVSLRRSVHHRHMVCLPLTTPRRCLTLSTSASVLDRAEARPSRRPRASLRVPVMRSISDCRSPASALTTVSRDCRGEWAKGKDTHGCEKGQAKGGVRV